LVAAAEGGGDLEVVAVFGKVAHSEHELGERVLRVGHGVGRRVAGDGPARVHDEGAHAVLVLPEGPVLAPAGEFARANLLVHRARYLDAGFDVVIEQALGQVKGRRRHLMPLAVG
jgi:hypothetical protein